MVRHGTLKKRRSGRKVVRKAPKHNAIKIRNAISDQVIKKNWDTSLSPHANFISMGLSPDPNNIQSRNFERHDNITSDKSGFMGFLKLPTGNLTEKNPNRTVLTWFDQEYLLTLMNKHGTNFHKMSHDLQLNHLQYTEKKLSKMYEKYLTLPEEQKSKRELPTVPSSSSS